MLDQGVSDSVRRPARRSITSSACAYRRIEVAERRGIEDEHTLGAGRRGRQALHGRQPAGGVAPGELIFGARAVQVVMGGDGRQQNLLDRALDRAQGQALFEHSVGKVLVECGKRVREPGIRGRAAPALLGERNCRGDVVRLGQRLLERLDLGKRVRAMSAGGALGLGEAIAPLPATQRVGAHAQHARRRIGTDHPAQYRPPNRCKVATQQGLQRFEGARMRLSDATTPVPPQRWGLAMRLRLYHHGDGARVAYREIGAGPPLALLHSLWLSHREWEPVVEPLSARFRVILPDLPLHGDSEDRPRHPYTPPLAGRGPRRLLPGSARAPTAACRPRPRRRARAAGDRGRGAHPARLVLMPNRMHRREPFAGRRTLWRELCRAAVVPGIDRLLSHLAPFVFSPSMGMRLSHQRNPAARDLVRHAFADVPGQRQPRSGVGQVRAPLAGRCPARPARGVLAD